MPSIQLDNNHQKILKLIYQQSDQTRPDFKSYGLKYCGSKLPGYKLDTAAHKQIIKDFLNSNDLSESQLTNLITSLYTQGNSFDEIILAGRLPGYFKDIRSQLNPKILDTWLNYTHGWAEVDTLCQMNFTDTDLFTNWEKWQKILVKLNKDKNIHKRRASLVLLTKPVNLSSDLRLSKLAFTNIENLKSEKDILITKAVSWILRSLIKHHPDQVKIYLQDNRNNLPKIALREATSKLLTGKKFVRKTTGK